MPVRKHTLAYNAETHQVIKPRGLRQDFANAVEYDPVRDKGKLVCIHCKQARMFHRDEKAAIAGSNEFGWNSHFSTIGSREPKKQKLDKEGKPVPYIPNLHKALCVAAVVKADHESEIDETKGYKIYIDMGHISRPFKRNAALIARDPETRRIVNLDPDLEGRERVTLKSPKDFITEIQKLDVDRLNNSVVIYSNKKYTFPELFIRVEPRSTGHPLIRWVNLGKNLLNGRQFPVFAHLSLNGKEPEKLKDERKGDWRRYHLGTVVVDHAVEHRKVTVKYWMTVRNEHMFDMIENSPTGEFIGLVKPDSYFDKDKRGILHVDLAFSEPGRIMETDLLAISLEAKRKAEKRAELLAAPSPAN